MSSSAMYRCRPLPSPVCGEVSAPPAMRGCRPHSGLRRGLAVDNGGRNSVGHTDAEYILAGFRVIFPVALVRGDGCSAVILKAEAENFLKLLRVDIKSGYGVCRVGISSAKIASSEDEINGGAVKRRSCFFKTFRHISCADRRRIFICRKKRAEARFSVIFLNST